MHKLDLFINHEERDERGQSLVEFVLVLPIILVMIAGVLEVTNIILKYNNVQQAAREGARYAAGGGVDKGVDEVVLDTITSNLTEDNVESIWVIRPVVAFNGNTLEWAPVGSSGWGVDEVCIYPDPCTDPDSGLGWNEIAANFNNGQGYIDSSRDDIVNSLSGETMTIVVVNYKAQTILNLSFFDYFGPDGTLPLRAWTVMRQEIESETLEKFNSGCSAYPIAINLLQEDDGVKIYQASDGDTFTLARNSATTSGYAEGYGYLKWGPSSSLPTDLANPATSTTGYYDAKDSLDTTLHRENWVWASSDNPGSALGAHMDAERALRVIGYYYSDGSVTPEENPATFSSSRIYQIDAFIIIKVVEINGDDVTFEFLRMDNSCGYDLD